jgi:transposase-like protein
MLEKNSSKNLPLCPYKPCQEAHPQKGEVPPSPNSNPVVRYGSFRRADGSKLIPRYRCTSCRRTFSSATFSLKFKQKKRTLNHWVDLLLNSDVSQRRIALLLKLNLKTVERKFLFLSVQAKRERLAELERLVAEQDPSSLIKALQFDEMESSERSKCLPLSIPLAVLPGSRKILSFRVCEMPANGPLAQISRQKYGPRRDLRAQAASSLFQEIAPLLHPEVEILTDQNPKYPHWLKPHFPKMKHVAVKGRRGCVVGQGELKKIGFDPLFSLNHTCAMLRANINRLGRRTWCTTKRADRLEAHIELYIRFHNQTLIRK